MDAELLKNKVYYSQNREDLILEAFFPDLKNGFYVDIGASDPVKYSVTKLFYDKGWSGINIEPIKHHFASLKKQRPRDINLNIGVGSKNTSLTFHEYVGGDGLSTFSSEIADQYSHREDFAFHDKKRSDISIRTLRDVFSEYEVSHIHFMKIDVEGFEYDVLAGNDWKLYRPEVICIEANHITKDWRPLLAKHGYALSFFDGLNNYYTDTKTDRETKFDFVKSVVSGRDGGLSFSDYEMLRRQQEATRDAHLRLQETLQSLSEQTLLYQALLSENHINNSRAAVAEGALRRPAAFMKYQLKKTHGFVLRKLTKNTTFSRSQQDERKLQTLKEKIATSANDDELLRFAKAIADIELNDRERHYYYAQEEPVMLRAYVRSVNTLQRLKMKVKSK